MGKINFNDSNMQMSCLINQLKANVQLYELNDDLTLQYANSGFYRLCGCDEKTYREISNGSHMIALAEGSVKIKMDIFTQMQENQSYCVEYRINSYNQENVWIREEGNWLDERKEIVISVLNDITKQKQLEESLQISEKRYEIAIDRSDVTLFDYDIVSKQMIFCDDDMKKFGFPRMIDNSIDYLIEKKLIHPSSVKKFIELYQKVIDGAKFAKDNISIYVNEGEIRIFEISLSTLFDKNGKAIRAIGVKKDITDLMMLQREKEYNHMLTSDHSMIYEANITKDIVLVSNLPCIEKELPFSEYIQVYLDEVIYPPHQGKVHNALSSQNILANFKAGENRFSVTYLAKNELGKYRWIKNTTNVVCDLLSNDVIIRCYTSDVHDQKEIDYRNGAQAKHYQALLSKSSAYYEINLTRNEFLSGYEKWNELFKIECKNYESMVLEFVQKAVHSEDQSDYLKVFSRAHLIESYYHGESKIVHEYRELNQSSVFRWVRYTIHLYEDAFDGDVFADGYVEMIHEEKEKELKLIYKSQHDLLTGYLNKTTLEERVEEFLALPEAKERKHAFLIIDLDSFKSINDNFGHAFGDAVLSRASAKIASLFRDVDILGRIGGDEFVVFMKNIRFDANVINKANEIFETIYESYIQNGIEINVSASIGIAYYSTHGSTYQELYEHSDTALYYSKEHGRNRYTVYSPDMRHSLTKIKKIDENALIEVKKFDENIIEYIFRILYESKDKSSAIRAVLALVGKHYNVSRTYVFEDSVDGVYTHNTFEWCNNGIEPQIDNLQFVPYSGLGNYQRNFNEDGIFYMPDIELQEEAMQLILKPQGVRSMLQFSIVKKGKFAGFIGFDQCGFIRIPSAKEISDVKNIANILGVFIMEMRAMEENEMSKNLALSIVNGLDSYAYVCDPETHRVLYINEQTLVIQPTASVGQFCYKAFWNREEPCENCPMAALQASHQSRITYDIENTNLNVWVRATASWIDWINSTKVCLVDSVDITEYKK